MRDRLVRGKLQLAFLRAYWAALGAYLSAVKQRPDLRTLREGQLLCPETAQISWDRVVKGMLKLGVHLRAVKKRTAALKDSADEAGAPEGAASSASGPSTES